LPTAKDKRSRRVVDAMDPDAFARSWLAAFNARDVDAIMAHYAEGIEHSSPTVVRVLGEPSGIVRGKAALRVYFEKALAAAPADLRYETLRLHVGVDGLTLVYHRTGGKIVAETFHFDRDGRVVRAFVAHAEA
jgi:ketosteroid isomerase-like protein